MTEFEVAIIGASDAQLQRRAVGLSAEKFDTAARAIKPGDATALCNLAIVKYQMGEKSEAMNDFRNALQSAKNSEIFLTRAQCYFLDRNFSDAIADAREAMLLDGENPDVYAFIGDVEIEKSDYEGAIESFGVAIELKPDHPRYYLGRASASIKHELLSVVKQPMVCKNLTRTPIGSIPYLQSLSHRSHHRFEGLGF